MQDYVRVERCCPVAIVYAGVSREPFPDLAAGHLVKFGRLVYKTSVRLHDCRAGIVPGGDPWVALARQMRGGWTDNNVQ